MNTTTAGTSSSYSSKPRTPSVAPGVVPSVASTATPLVVPLAFQIDSQKSLTHNGDTVHNTKSIAELLSIADNDSNVRFPPLPAVILRSLNSPQLCQLFDHCYLYNLEDFILRNKLTGNLIPFTLLITF